MDDATLGDVTQARKAARRLARVEPNTRRAALARYVDLLAPEHRPEGLPEPAAVDGWEDPLDRIVAKEPFPGGLRVTVRAPPSLVLASVDRAGEARRLCALAIGSGAGLALAVEDADGRTSGLVEARQALSEAGLPSEAVTRLDRDVIGGDLPSLGRAHDVVIMTSDEDSASVHEPDPAGASEAGVTHTYVDGDVEAQAALATCVAAVAGSGPGPTTDTLLVHEALAGTLVSRLHDRLSEAGLRLEAGEAARRRAPEAHRAEAATWAQPEAGVCGLRLVGSLEEALEHVQAHGPGPAAAVLTRDREAALAFLEATDAPRGLWNASTQEAEPGEEGDRGARRLSEVPEEPHELTRTRSLWLGGIASTHETAASSLASLVRSR